MALEDRQNETYLENAEDGTTSRNIVYGDLMRRFEDHHKCMFDVLQDIQAQNRRYTFRVFNLRARTSNPKLMKGYYVLS